PAAITLPSHVSMLTGVPPEVHGVMWNADLPLERAVYPASATIFELAHACGYTTAMAAGKSKFSVLVKPGTIDWVSVPTSSTTEDPAVASNAANILRQHQPNLLFVHFATVDTVGHARGWGSPEQVRAIEDADKLVGGLLDELDELKLRESTFVLLTADH